MRALKVFVLLIVALMLLCFAGCGEDDDSYCSDNVPPTVITDRNDREASKNPI